MFNVNGGSLIPRGLGTRPCVCVCVGGGDVCGGMCVDG